MTAKSTDPKASLRHFFAGASPAAAAILLLLVHALRPIVAHEHQGFVFVTAGGLIALSLAVWCWCVVTGVAVPFAVRNQAADERQELTLQQIADNHAELTQILHRVDRSIQAGHKRLGVIEKRLTAAQAERHDITAEVEHLRALLLQTESLTSLGSERLGPRALH